MVLYVVLAVDTATCAPCLARREENSGIDKDARR